MTNPIYTQGELRKILIREHKCTVPMCAQTKMKKRKKPPNTANFEVAHLFDYWQCPRCKTNRAYVKNK